jgi:steroid delta-isomerase-like uncharacterized protein
VDVEDFPTINTAYSGHMPDPHQPVPHQPTSPTTRSLDFKRRDGDQDERVTTLRHPQNGPEPPALAEQGGKKMSIEENKAIARRFIRVWDTDDPSILGELAAPDIRVSYPILPGPIQGAGAFKEVLAGVRAGLPDIKIEIGDVIAEGDFVVAPWTMSGTHLGDLMGIPPSGRGVRWCGITIYRIEDGKVVDERGEEDGLGLLRQIGAMPG